MDKNKYLDAFAEIAKQCAQELIKLLVDNKVTELTFSEEDEKTDYLPSIVFFDDDEGDGTVCELRKLQLVTNEGEPYIKIVGESIYGITKYGAYIDKYGGEMYDVEHSIGHIYQAVVEKLGLA